MRRTFLLLCLATIFQLPARTDLSAQSSNQARATLDEKAIRVQITTAEAAINKRDFAALGALYTPDADAIIGSAPTSTDPNAIRRDLAAAWAKFPANRRITITIDAIRFVTSDVAIVNTTALFTEGEPLEDRGTWVMVRRDGAWRIAAVRVQPAQRR